MEIRSSGLDIRYDVAFAGPDLDALEHIDAPALAAEADGVEADGIVSSKDRGALFAAALTARRRLPGPAPAAVASCQHKPTARRLQQRAAPAATPRWFVPDDGPSPFPPPWFVKPAVGRLSMGARRVDNAADLPRAGRDDDAYASGWEALARLGGVELDGHGWVAGGVPTREPGARGGCAQAGR